MVHLWTWRLTVLALTDKFQYLWIEEIEGDSSGFFYRRVPISFGMIGFDSCSSCHVSSSLQFKQQCFIIFSFYIFFN